MTRLIAIFLFALLAMPATAAGVFKCTNAEGKTYYSERACPKDESTERLRVPKASADDEAPAEGAEGSSLDQQIANATDPVIKAQLELRKKECELARTQLQRYEGAPYLVEQQDDGTQRRLSDEEAAAQKQQLRDLIAQRCQ